MCGNLEMSCYMFGEDLLSSGFVFACVDGQ